MRISPLVLCALLPAPVMADDCADRLSALLGATPFDGQPYIAETVTVSGGMKGQFTQNWASPRHSLMVTHEPPGMPDTLHYEGATYMADGNGGWTKLYEADPDQQQADTAAMQATMAAAVTTATCGTENRAGKDLDSLAAALPGLPYYEGDLSVRYLVDPTSGDVAFMDMAYTMADIDNTVTFAFTRVPDMALPVP